MGTYRDELKAAQARADALARELDRAREEIAHLKGESLALVPASPGALERAGGPRTASHGLLGAPYRLRYTRTVEGEVPETAYGELVEKIREHMDNVGAVSSFPGSFAWTPAVNPGSTGPFATVEISIRDGMSTIRVEERLTNLAGGIFGGIGGGVGGGGILVPIGVSIAAPWLAPVAFGAWFGGVYALCRRLYRRSAEKRAERLEALADELAEIAKRRAVPPPERAAAAEGQGGDRS